MPPTTLTDPISGPAKPPEPDMILERLGVAPSDDGVISYGVVVKNSTPRPMDDVRVVHRFPTGVTILGVSPKATKSGDCLNWVIGSVPPGKGAKIVVAVRAGAGDWRPPSEAAFKAEYRTSAVYQTRVTRPRLALAIDTITTVRVGGSVQVGVRVTNAGNAPATGVAVRLTPPPSLEPEAAEAVSVAIGDLAPGETVRLISGLRAVATGDARLSAHAVADEDLAADGEAEVIVKPAPISVRLSGPTRPDHGGSAVFRVEVTNSGDDQLPPTRLALTATGGVELVGANGDFSQTTADGEARWQCPAISPGGMAVAELTHDVVAPGPFGVAVEANAAGVRAATRLDGLVPMPPSLGLIEHLLRESATPATAEAGAVGNRHAGSNGHPDKTVRPRSVVFRIGAELYAIPMTIIREVSRTPAVTPVPGSPDWLLGTANLRGTILSVGCLATLLGMPTSDNDCKERMLVLHPGSSTDDPVGLLVAAVEGIVSLPATRRVAADGPGGADFLAGVCEVAGRLVRVIDVDHLAVALTSAVEG